MFKLTNLFDQFMNKNWSNFFLFKEMVKKKNYTVMRCRSVGAHLKCNIFSISDSFSFLVFLFEYKNPSSSSHFFFSNIHKLNRKFFFDGFASAAFRYTSGMSQSKDYSPRSRTESIRYDTHTTTTTTKNILSIILFLFFWILFAFAYKLKITSFNTKKKQQQHTHW